MQADSVTYVGRNGRDQRAHNLRRLYQWLSTFHFTTRALITAALELKFAPLRLLRWAKDQGLIQWHSFPGGPLLMLTRRGKFEASLVFPEAIRYRTSPASVTISTIRHELALQRVVLAERIALEDITPAWLLEHNELKTPDAIYDGEGGVFAMEIELTVKTHKRIYIGFTDHLCAMRAEEYDGVRYLFAHPNHCATYQRLFDEPRWPRYVYASAKRAHVIDPTRPKFALAELPGMAEKFSFEVHEALVKPDPISHRSTVRLEPADAQAQTASEGPEGQEAFPSAAIDAREAG